MSAWPRTGSVLPASWRGRAPVTRPSSSTPISNQAAPSLLRLARQTTVLTSSRSVNAAASSACELHGECFSALDERSEMFWRQETLPPYNGGYSRTVIGSFRPSTLGSLGVTVIRFARGVIQPPVDRFFPKSPMTTDLLGWNIAFTDHFVRDFRFACPRWHLYTPESRRAHEILGSSQRSVQLRPVYMANKSSINSDLRGWKTPSVSGEELQTPAVRPTGDGGIARGLPVPRG